MMDEVSEILLSLTRSISLLNHIIMIKITTRVHLYRYDMMMSCWYAQPSQRPEFSSLVKQLSQLLDSDPAYMKLGDL